MEGIVAEVTREDRFHGTCNLVVLHLRRAAKSNDIEKGFETARAMGMLKPEREAFIRHCLAIDEKRSESVTDELIHELQACVLSLNTADPA